MKYLSVLLFASVFLACKGSEKKAGEASADKTITNANAGLHSSFEMLMAGYYELKDALVASDTSKANSAAQKIVLAADSLNLEELKAIDSNNVLVPTVQQYSGTISAEAKGLLGEAGLEAKRKEFQMITGNLYELARTIRYDKQRIYLINCPMAFDNEGADWLNPSPEIRNPYFGDKMLTCGSVKDSLVLK